MEFDIARGPETVDRSVVMLKHVENYLFLTHGLHLRGNLPLGHQLANVQLPRALFFSSGINTHFSVLLPLPSLKLPRSYLWPRSIVALSFPLASWRASPEAAFNSVLVIGHQHHVRPTNSSGGFNRITVCRRRPMISSLLIADAVPKHRLEYGVYTEFTECFKVSQWQSRLVYRIL